MSNFSFSGGEKLASAIQSLLKKANSDSLLKVGFFEGSTESENGASTPLVAYVNEFGGAIAGDVGSDGLDSEGNKVQNRPPRPFFRRMIAQGAPHWGDDLGKILEHHDMDADAALTELGMQMKDELVESIVANVYVPLTKATIARKGFDQTLIESGDMQNAVDFNVD